MPDPDQRIRANEWYVPRFGPQKFRLFVGLTFYPYTLMNASYVVVGSMLATTVHLDRVFAITVVYILSVGISAHSLDALGPNKPWGTFMSRRTLLALAFLGLAVALPLGAYYALLYAPLLFVVGLAEVFFLLAYNLELFRGRFHTDLWFAFSWGFLPVVAGYVVQTNSLGPAALLGGAFGLSTAFVEIKASRPYKELKRNPGDQYALLAPKFESILKGVVASALSIAALLTIFRFV